MLEIESIDRMYVNVYVPQLQYTGGVASFFQAHRGHRFAVLGVDGPDQQGCGRGERRADGLVGICGDPPCPAIGEWDQVCYRDRHRWVVAVNLVWRTQSTRKEADYDRGTAASGQVVDLVSAEVVPFGEILPYVGIAGRRQLINQPGRQSGVASESTAQLRSPLLIGPGRRSSRPRARLPGGHAWSLVQPTAGSPGLPWATVLTLAPAPGGFPVAALASKVRVMTGQTKTDYTAWQAAYDLRKLRLAKHR